MKKIISLRMEQEEIDFLEKEAKKLDLSVSSYVRMVLFKYNYFFSEKTDHINKKTGRIVSYEPYFKGNIMITNEVIKNEGKEN
jgi:hypothetical protein